MIIDKVRAVLGAHPFTAGYLTMLALGALVGQVDQGAGALIVCCAVFGTAYVLWRRTQRDRDR